MSHRLAFSRKFCGASATALALLGGCGGRSVPLAGPASDGEGEAEAESEPEPALQVTARFPWNGYATGSVWATGEDLVVDSRRPKFMWDAVPGATRYDLEVDNSCAMASFRACLFSSREIAASLAKTTYLTGVALPVSETAPVGTRYYWRVRACADECGPWSAVRYLDVGRQAKDFNGDGFADVIVGARGQDNGATDEGNAFLHYGSPAGLAELQDVRLDNPDNQTSGNFAAAVASAGDINGDGFADVIVGAALQDSSEPDEGNVFFYYGTNTGVAPYPNSLRNPDKQAAGRFGRSVAGAGDVNGDGFADVVVGALYQDNGAADEGNAFIYYGAASGGLAELPDVRLDNPDNQANGWFGSSVASAGDINGDGFVDIVVGAATQDGDMLDEGAAFAYFGSPSGLTDTYDLRFDNPDNQASSFFGYSVASAGDVNGDGFAEIVIGGSSQDSGATDDGSAFVYYGAGSRSGSGSGADSTHDARLDNPDGQELGLFGIAVASAGDVDLDGFADIVVGANNQEHGAFGEGNAFLYLGAASGISPVHDVRLDNPDNQPNTDFGSAVSSAGDINGDGFCDVIVGAPFYDSGAAGEGNAFVYFGAPSGLPDVPGVRLDNPDNQAFGNFGWSVD